jgi:hypothetical protein
MRCVRLFLVVGVWIELCMPKRHTVLNAVRSLGYAGLFRAFFGY